MTRVSHCSAREEGGAPASPVLGAPSQNQSSSRARPSSSLGMLRPIPLLLELLVLYNSPGEIKNAGGRKREPQKLPNGTAEGCQEEEFTLPAIERVLLRTEGPIGRRWLPVGSEEPGRLQESRAQGVQTLPSSPSASMRSCTKKGVILFMPYLELIDLNLVNQLTPSTGGSSQSALSSCTKSSFKAFT